MTFAYGFLNGGVILGVGFRGLRGFVTLTPATAAATATTPATAAIGSGCALAKVGRVGTLYRDVISREVNRLAEIIPHFRIVDGLRSLGEGLTVAIAAAATITTTTAPTVAAIAITTIIAL